MRRCVSGKEQQKLIRTGDGTYLTGRVNNLGGEIAALKPDHLAESVLYGRIIALDEVAVDELDGERTFACIAPDTSLSAITRNHAQ